MKELPALGGMDLAALLCSRICHDIISPVGAILQSGPLPTALSCWMRKRMKKPKPLPEN